MKPTTCSKCHSEKIISNVFIEDKGMSNVPWSLSVRVDEKPDAIVFKGRHTDTIRAWLCGECGFTELYVENPQQLYAAYTKTLPEETS